MAKVAKITKVVQIDSEKVKAGRLIKVKNTQKPKFSNANNEYFAVWVENANGKKERCWFLTEKDIARLDHRSEQNKEDWTDKTFWTNLLD